MTKQAPVNNAYPNTIVKVMSFDDPDHECNGC